MGKLKSLFTEIITPAERNQQSYDKSNHFLRNEGLMHREVKPRESVLVQSIRFTRKTQEYGGKAVGVANKIIDVSAKITGQTKKSKHRGGLFDLEF